MTKQEYIRRNKSLKEDVKFIEMELFAYKIAKVRYAEMLLKNSKVYDKDFKEHIDRRISLFNHQLEVNKELLIALNEEYLKSLERGEAL